MDETREAVARAILHRRIKPDFRAVVDGAWIVDHDRELADAALAALKIGSRFTVEGVDMMVVPVEPDEAMRLAGRTELRSLFGESPCTADAADTYRAMLRACEEKGMADERTSYPVRR